MPILQPSIQRNQPLILLFTAGMNMIFVLPVLIPYYQEVIGLGFTEFMLGEAAFSLVVIVMEVPSGWLSDVWRRKAVLALGSVAYLSGFTFFMLANSFLTATLAQAWLGVGVSLVSGTINAVLYDTLLAQGQEGEYRRLEGRRHGVALYTVGLSALAGGFLYTVHPKLPLALSIVAGGLCLVSALALVEPPRLKAPVRRSPLHDMRLTLRFALGGQREIAGVIVIGALLFAVSKCFLWAQQAYYIALGLPEQWFGPLVALGFLLGGLAGQWGHRLGDRLSHRTVLALILGLEVLACAGAGVALGWHGAPLLLTGSLVWGFGWPHVQDYINRRVDSARRATVLSAASLMIQLVFIPVGAGLGWMSDSFGIDMALLTLGGVALLIGGVALVGTGTGDARG